MRVTKKIVSWILVVALLCSSLTPVLEVHATEGGTTSETASENTTTTEATTEATTETTTEETTEEDTSSPNSSASYSVNAKGFAVSKLSPVNSKVIVLDPGHCKVHTGASANGLREEVVVLDIAKACQSKLNQYGDVTVYMTRTTGNCCEALKLGDCLSSRNNYAKILDADFLISMHINAGSSSGANVLTAYQSGYHDSIRKETQAFGRLVLKKLKAIGIANRGLLLRKSEAGNRYSNGKLADYYSIVRRGVVQNIPSVIIEHGYVTSASDCRKFFKTAAQRKKLGQTDADAVISYYGLKKKVISGSFKKEDGATYFVTSNERKVTGWVKKSGAWYYLGANGKRKTGFVTVGKNTFYLSKSTGKMKVGWFKVSGNTYLTRGDGTLVKNTSYTDGIHTYLFDSTGRQILKAGLYTVAGNTYYVDKWGYVKTGVQKVKGKYYLFDLETGKMLYGYQNQNGKYYYLNSQTGVMARNKMVNIRGKKYYFSSTGVRKTGWVKYRGSKYYFSKKNGAMVTGWQKIGKKYYYFSKSTGKMQKNKWIGKYYVNSKGVRTKKK